MVGRSILRKVKLGFCCKKRTQELTHIVTFLSFLTFLSFCLKRKKIRKKNGSAGTETSSPESFDKNLFQNHRRKRQFHRYLPLKEQITVLVRAMDEVIPECPVLRRVSRSISRKSPCFDFLCRRFPFALCVFVMIPHLRSLALTCSTEIVQDSCGSGSVVQNIESGHYAHHFVWITGDALQENHNHFTFSHQEMEEAPKDKICRFDKSVCVS